MVGARLSWLRIVGDLVHFLCLGSRSRTSLAAENLFLRKQLAFYEERKVKPRRADNPNRLSLVLLSRSARGPFKDRARPLHIWQRFRVELDPHSELSYGLGLESGAGTLATR